MNDRNHGCGPRGRVEINLPEALFAMRGGRGWQGGWGPFHFDFGDENWSGRRGPPKQANVRSRASFGWCS